jgi:hypothetical protein
MKKPLTITITLRPDVDRDHIAMIYAHLLNNPDVIRVNMPTADLNAIPRPNGRPRNIAEV